MISIWPKKPTVERVAVVDDVFIDHMPLPPMPERAAGRDFNIILVVQEHAPARLKEIDKMVADHTRQIEKLKKESTQLRRLLAALDVPKGKKVSPSN